jgi:hypothetical protein
MTVQSQSNVFNVSFSNSGASVLAPEFNTPIVGAGVTYNQAASSLNVVAGTTVNAEFLTRSSRAWTGTFRAKFGIIASQRIANNNFAVLLADRIGENLLFRMDSATSVTVFLPGHSFTDLNVGQFMLLGGINGNAAGVPGRYAIASVVPGVSITFTVAGWPASGEGYVTLFGHSYVRNLFNGTTATSVLFDAQRRGWASGDTTAAIRTTASPGVVLHNELTGRELFLLDQLRASSATPGGASQASRIENLPDEDLDLHLWIWSYNGTVAPASSTTFSLGFLSVEHFANSNVYLQGIRTQGSVNPLPVDTLAALGVARQLAAGAASANTALTTTCRRVSIHARTADIRYVIGIGAQTASATSHFIAAGERLDLDVLASAQIAVIRAGSTDGVLELSELT